MANPRQECLSHPEIKVYRSWMESLSLGKLAEGTVYQYTYEVARFLAAHLRRRLGTVTENTIVRYKGKVPLGSTPRAVSALGQFFQYALEQRLPGMVYNPVYRARGKRDPEELSLMDLMLRNNIPEHRVREIRWKDVLPVLSQRSQSKTIRIGKRVVRLQSRVCRRLERELRRHLARRSDIGSLLNSRVAC